MTGPLELIIFDCDGVLVDSEPIANAVLAKWLTQQGLPTTPEQSMARYTGLSLKTVQERAEEALGRPLPASFMDDMQAETFEALRQSLEPVDGAMEVVEWVKAQGLKACVASSGGYDKLDLTLTKTGLKEAFRGHIYSSVEVKNGKPAPDLFLYAAGQMGSAPSATMVIEDSAAGVEAARAAGMDVIAYGAHQPATGVCPVSSLIDAIQYLRVRTS